MLEGDASTPNLKLSDTAEKIRQVSSPASCVCLIEWIALSYFGDSLPSYSFASGCSYPLPLSAHISALSFANSLAHLLILG